MHHAYDAFLAATMGNFVERFIPWLDSESFAAIRVRKAQEAAKGDDTLKVDLSSKHGMILAAFSRDQLDVHTGEIIRKAQQDIGYLKEVWGYHDGHVVFLKRQKSGAFYDETRYRAGNVKAKFALKKTLDTKKYGGFNSIKPAYIAAISYQKGKKRVGELVNVPIYLAEAIEKDPKALIEYLEKDHSDVQIIRPKILMNQRIEYEGSELLLRSCSEMYNARELFIPTYLHQTLWKLHKAPKQLKPDDEEHINALISLLMEKMEKQYPIFKGVAERLSVINFDTLSFQEKCIFIVETMKVMAVNGRCAMYKTALSRKDLSDKQGRITNKALDLSHITLIDQSITGLREKRTKLWPDSEPS